jgi:hypothetical protein
MRFGGSRQDCMRNETSHRTRNTNHLMSQFSWNGHKITRGMEFGVSPVPESRREMVERSLLFGTPTYCWLSAKARLETEYWIVTQSADCIPEHLTWPVSAETLT